MDPNTLRSWLTGFVAFLILLAIPKEPPTRNTGAPVQLEFNFRKRQPRYPTYPCAGWVRTPSGGYRHIRARADLS